MGPKLPGENNLETTGVDPETDRIVTACVVQCGGGQPTESAVWLSDVDGETIPAEATKVHGITTGIAQTQGAPAAEVVEELVAALAAAQGEGIPIVAMNAAFDLTLLDREARRHGVDPLVDIVGLENLRVIDPRVIDKQFSRRRGRRTLTDLCDYYRIRLDDAHSADADAIAACRVAWRLGQRHPRLQRADLQRLHLLQIGWAADQNDSLLDHFARTPGKEHLAASVRSEWPLIPYQTTTEEATA